MAARVLSEARRVLPRDKIVAACSGTVRPSPGASSLVLAVVAVALTAGLVVGLGMTPLVAVPIAAGVALAVAAGLGAFATELVVFAVTRRDVVVLEMARGRAGDVLARVPTAEVEVTPYWDRRWKRVRAGDRRAYVSIRTYPAALGALSRD